MATLLDQALYGYEEGHRRLASSVRMDKETDRVLRVVTDLKIASPDRRYLTIVPLPSIGSHAFIRTWAAGPGFRPGSVWSHVLLMPWGVLDRVEDVASIVHAFRRPDASAPGDLVVAREAYQTKVPLPPPTAPAAQVANFVARQVVCAAYDRTRTSEVVVENAGQHEHLLLALLTQGWPEVRRTTALRTRHRRSESSAANFVVEVVERPSARRPVEDLPVGTWLDLLTRDLEVPDIAMRQWLRRFGEDAGDERTVMPLLVDLYHGTHVGNAPDVLRRLTQDLPAPEQFPSLKQALFGRCRDDVDGVTWPCRERDRLAMLLGMGGAVDLRALDLETRLIDLTSNDEEGAVQLAISTDWASIHADSAREAFFTALRANLSARDVGVVAISRPEDAEFLLRTRPDAWSQAPLWLNSATQPIVRSLIAAADRSNLRSTFLDLVVTDEIDVAMILVRDHPQVWWSLFSPGVAQQIISNPEVRAAAQRLLEIAGPKKVGRADPPLESPVQLEALVAVAVPDMALWHTTKPEDWLRLVSHPAPPSLARTAAMSIALASAERSKDLKAREQAWQSVFGELHKALDFGGSPAGFEKTLDRALPGGASWDWCGRLREGLARVAVDAGWSAEKIRVQADGAGNFANDVARRVQHRLDKSSGGGLLDAIGRLFGQ